MSTYSSFRDKLLPAWKKEFDREIEEGLYPVLRNHPYVIFKNMGACDKFSENQIQVGLLSLREMDQRVKSTGGLANHLLRELFFTLKQA